MLALFRREHTILTAGWTRELIEMKNGDFLEFSPPQKTNLTDCGNKGGDLNKQTETTFDVLWTMFIVHCSYFFLSHKSNAQNEFKLYQ